MIRIAAECMPFGMGSFPELMPIGMGSFPELVPVGRVRVSLAYAFWDG